MICAVLSTTNLPLLGFCCLYLQHTLCTFQQGQADHTSGKARAIQYASCSYYVRASIWISEQAESLWDEINLQRPWRPIHCLLILNHRGVWSRPQSSHFSETSVQISLLPFLSYLSDTHIAPMSLHRI